MMRFSSLCSLIFLPPLKSMAHVGIETPPVSKYREQYGVIVLCKDEAHQQRVYEESR
jgi:hypothetical protein